MTARTYALTLTESELTAIESALTTARQPADAPIVDPLFRKIEAARLTVPPGFVAVSRDCGDTETAERLHEYADNALTHDRATGLPVETLDRSGAVVTVICREIDREYWRSELLYWRH